MNPNTKKIIQIKDTIKEIRYDIKEMEKKNDSKIKSLITSISPYQSLSQSQSDYQSSSFSENNIPNINDEATKDLISKYDSIDQPQNTYCLNSSSSSINYNKFEPSDNYSNDIIYTYTNNYKEEETKLRKYLLELQDQNHQLTVSLNEKQIENNSLLQRKAKEDIYLTIQYLLEGQEIKDLIQKIDEMENGHKDSSLRNELVSKMKSLYLMLTETNEESEIDIKIIWRWIKHLIRTVKEMANEKEHTFQLVNDFNDTLYYREFCTNLMHENNLGSIAELKGFIKKLYAKAHIGEKRIDKLKKVLFLSPQMKPREIEHKQRV